MNNKKIEELVDSVAYCGLVCGLCDHAPECTWCRNPRSDKDKCAKDTCYHRKCCLEKGLDGCWQCNLFPCDNGRFVDENTGQAVGFIECIRKKGIKEFISVLLCNEERGIIYGMFGDYRLKPLKEIMRLLSMSDG